MTDTNIFALAQVIKAAGNDPSAVVDAVWAAGYRQPERSAEEAAKITIDTFYYCESFGMPTDFWPKTYDDVLKNEMMKAVLDEDADHLFDVEPTKAAKSILAAGFSLEHRTIENAGEPEKCRSSEKLQVNDVTTGKALTITLPDTSSKAFWSDAGKCEVFHPETYRRWAKEAIERDCVIGGIVVEVR